jgi:hypothetical protein
MSVMNIKPLPMLIVDAKPQSEPVNRLLANKN